MLLLVKTLKKFCEGGGGEDTNFTDLSIDTISDA